MRALQQIVEGHPEGEYAQNKATSDVACVLDKLGFERINIFRNQHVGLIRNLDRVMWIVRCLFWRRKIKSEAIVVVQYTITCWHGKLAFWLLNENIKTTKGLRIVSVIHDINRMDVSSGKLSEHEKRYFNMCDKIVVHCNNMREYLCNNGVDRNKVVVLGVFDYLLDHPIKQLVSAKSNVVNCCGNLSSHKCGCFRELKKINGVEWRLYGPNLDCEYLSESVRHLGVFPPDRLPDLIKTGFGLVWDGDSVETQTGLFGVYQQYICSHKVSLYLASGIPVIVWKNSGMAEFVNDNGVGFVVSNLREIPSRISLMTEDEYSLMRLRVVELGNMLRRGEMTQLAVRECVSCL